MAFVVMGGLKGIVSINLLLVKLNLLFAFWFSRALRGVVMYILQYLSEK